MFGFEFVDDYDLAFLNKRKEYKQSINNVSQKLDKIKELSVGTEEYNNYTQAVIIKEQIKKDYFKLKETERLFGFESKKIFIKEFGIFFGFFIYALFNLYKSFSDKKNAGIKVLHTFIISVCMFYFFWIFQQFQDLSKVSYYFATIISSLLIVAAVYLITKYKEDKLEALKKSNYELSKFAFKYTRKDKEQEMFDVIRRNIP